MPYITPVASAARTASGNSSAIDGVGEWVTIRARLAVTAASGTTPTLDVVVEDTLDGGTNWHTVATFAQKATTGTEAVNITTPFTDRLRVRWTIAGTTPSFTFNVAMYGEQ